MKETIAQFLKVNDFPFFIKDKDNKLIYYENSDGYWIKNEYDQDGKEISYKNSNGLSSKTEYDQNGKLISYKNSNGYWSKREYDQNGNQIYSEDSNGFWAKTEYDQDGKEIYIENSEGIIFDKRPKTEPTRLSSSDLLAVLRNTPSADITAMKTASIINRSGHKITGFVLCHPETQERCIVEMSACRWLTNEEMWRLMHVSESPLT
jgi:YD repeat-containing protein